MPALLVLIAILALPMVEIGVFIAVGSQIGIGWTLALVVISFLLGIVLFRRQGFSTLKAAQTEARAGVVPERPIVHGAMIVMGSILLMIPGFVTDFFGLLLFIPPVRDMIWNAMRSRITVRAYGPGHRTYTTGTAHRVGPEVIDLPEDDFARRDGDPNSPWSDGQAGGNRTLPPDRS
ncbi:FxsA family protein [Aureimonas altamirensis]|uniref:FxsA family protein n=1 Tax=Aureimonas altamirensis TaxID=370622 RepID=UPI00301AAD73